MLALARRMEQQLRDAFLSSVSDIRSVVVLRQLSQAIETGDTERAIALLHLRPEFFDRFTRAHVAAYSEAGAALAPLMARALESRGSRSSGLARFTPTAPRAASWLASTGFQLVASFIEDQTEAVRLVLTAALVRGDRPETIAREIAGRYISGQRRGGILGLTPAQALSVDRARQELQTVSGSAAYLKRELRDRRFDPAVRSAIASGRRLSQQEIETIVARYSDRTLYYRALLIAKTEFHVAAEAAREESLQQLIERGIVSASQVERVWHSRGYDGRTRDTHLAMSGQVVQVGSPFRSPSGALLMHPGDRSLGAPAAEIVRCRCRSSVRRRKIG